jgi:hypothetical protein
VEAGKRSASSGSPESRATVQQDVEKDLTTEDSEDTEKDFPRKILGALFVLGGLIGVLQQRVGSG